MPLRAAARLTLLAMLAALLLPALARAVAGTSGTTWAEICTAQGTRLVPVAEGGEPTVSLHGAWDHCPWCLKLDAAPPPAKAGRPEPWPTARAAVALRAHDARPASLVWPVPPPRGPPPRHRA